jgi:hypothetical protein
MSSRRRKNLHGDPRLDAQVPLSGVPILAGAGVIGVVAMMLTWLVFHRQSSQVETTNLTGMSRNGGGTTQERGAEPAGNLRRDF